MASQRGCLFLGVPFWVP